MKSKFIIDCVGIKKLELESQKHGFYYKTIGKS